MVKKKSTQKAFTLPEMLMMLVIIGVLIVIMLTLVKPDKAVLKLQYYGAYNVLATAAYNISEKAIDENKIIYENDKLCQHLRYYINNNSSYECKGTFVPLNATDFKPEHIQFIASNGMVFYLSEAFSSNDFEQTQKHRIVWVDINGTRNPNSAKWTEVKPADIVAFDIIDTGEVIPLGYPKVDSRYLMAKIVYADDTKKSQAVTFYKAQQMAFGDKQYEYEPFSYNIDQKNALFNSSVLKIDQKYLDTERENQKDDCKNDDQELFPKCSVDIIK